MDDSREAMYTRMDRGMIVLDANILLRLADSKDPKHGITVGAVFRHARTDQLVMVAQSLYEFWAVATRSTAINGLGMDTTHVDRWINRYRRMFPLIADSELVVDKWQTLVKAHNVRGVQASDAHYVAAMLVQQIPKLMTYNIKHFRKFPIELVDPESP